MLKSCILFGVYWDSAVPDLVILFFPPKQIPVQMRMQTDQREEVNLKDKADLSEDVNQRVVSQLNYH